MDLHAPATSHPSEAILLGHVAGTLSLAHHLVVSTHAEGCEQCRATIRLCEEIGGIWLRNTPPPSGLLDQCLARIDAADPPAQTVRTTIGGLLLPASLSGLRPSRLRVLAPGLRHSTLWHDDRGTLHFIRVKAGTTLPAHRHRGLELTCVLSGAFHDDKGHYAAGDVAEEEDDQLGVITHETDHIVVADEPDHCVCIMATTGRLLFSGWLARLLQPVMPF
jgi:putative transcriptional regulator